MNPDDIGGVTITRDAFETVLPWFPYVLTVAVLLFAVPWRPVPLPAASPWKRSTPC